LSAANVFVERQHKADDKKASPVRPQKIESLQRLLVAVAVAKYGWKPQGKNPATGNNASSIAADVEKTLGQAIDADTVRTHLQDAAKAIGYTGSTN
jgi:hypothetical protein